MSPPKQKTKKTRADCKTKWKNNHSSRNKSYCRSWRQKQRLRSPVNSSDFTESEVGRTGQTHQKRKRCTNSNGSSLLKKRRRLLQGKRRSEQPPRVWESYVERYEEEIRQSCSHVCNCCGRLCYAKNITRIDRKNLESEGYEERFLDSVFAIEKHGNRKFCVTCRGNLRKRVIPRLCLNNGLHFPVVDPKISCLNRIEERLISPRHVFQSIWPVMGPNGQLKGKGGIVNVPIDIDTTVSSLPRSRDDSNIVHVHLTRKMEYQHDYMDGMARPVKVFEAGKCIVAKPLFREHEIHLTTNWLDVNDTIDCHSAESDFESPAFRFETLLLGYDSVRLAPAEGYTPRSVLLDPDSEYLAFPKLFGGYRMNPMYNGKPIPYSDVIKSFAMRFDRRVAERGDYLLFMAKKSELIKLHNNIGICLRKKSKNANCPITADDMLNLSFVSGLVQHDDGYMVLKGVRNSGAHWKHEKTKLLACIRQFGLPTFFITLSSADTRWPELLVLLKNTVDKEIITEEESSELSYSERARLVQKDPITCTLHFSRRFQELKKTWGCEDGPFGKYEISHHYHRIEFQQRGSPHVHMILWLKDAPICDTNERKKQQDVCSFIDSIITCSSNHVHEELVKLQAHKHTRTCQRRNGKEGCRFGIPYFPMKKTMILEPLDEDRFDMTEKNRLQDVCSKIREFQFQEESSILNFETFLRRLQLSEREYIYAIRSTLKRSQVFLRRKPCDMMINAYNPKILELMRSNMDIQFILDPYGCASYVLNYINKSDRGMSQLMEEVLKEIREGNDNLRHAMRKISNAHHNNSELSIQEACYNILQLPLSECTEECIFIPTSPLEKRVRMVRSTAELELLDQDSTDIFVHGLLQHYQNRPLQMESTTLADFAAYYRYSTQPLSKSSLPLLLNSGYVTKRIKPRVIRFVGYNYETNPEDYIREMLMLYEPLRNEQSDILDIDMDSKFSSCEKSILRVWSRYHELSDEVITLAFDEAARNVTADYDAENADPNRPVFDFDQYHDHFTDVLGGQHVTNAESFVTPSVISDDDYRALLEKLNPEQRDYVYHVAHHFESSTEPIYHFLTGGAGVGKSLVISAIYQILRRKFIQQDLDTTPDHTTILLCSSTGKSSFEIGGQTIHSTFHLPINQKELSELSPSISNTLATNLVKLKLVVIDEISMVGQNTLRMVDQRLRHLFDNNKFMGGISVITCGDFAQLDPVFSRPLYHPQSNNPYEEVFGVHIWRNFKVFRLKTIMRQNDPAFQIALNNMAVGQMTESDITLFRTRSFPDVPADLITGSDVVHLFPRNVDVDEWNISSLKQIPGEEIEVKASDVICGHGSVSAQRQMEHTAGKSSSKNIAGVPATVILKVGATYMITYNVNTSDGLSNGVTGKLRRIDFGTNSKGDRKPIRLWMEFNNERVGAKQRRKFHRLADHCGLPSTWTPVEPIVVKVLTNRKSTLHVNRKQFPLALAHALTIHKSQGMSIPQVVVHLKGHVSRSLLYVACSRATTLHGLFIIGSFKPPKPLPANSYLRQEMLRWENDSVCPIFKGLRKQSDQLQIMYHNVQSLPKNIGLIVNDSCFTNSHILCFGETWTKPSDDFHLPNFDIWERLDNEHSRRARGVHLYVRRDIRSWVKASGHFIVNVGKRRIEACWARVAHTTIVCIYASPRCDASAFRLFFNAINDLKSQQTVILGDFNVDSSLRNTIAPLANLYGLTLQNQSEPTTVRHSSLDWILTDCHVHTGTYVSFTSYHHPIYAHIPFSHM